jgi:hypothetical protein
MAGVIVVVDYARAKIEKLLLFFQCGAAQDIVVTQRLLVWQPR